MQKNDLFYGISTFSDGNCRGRVKFSMQGHFGSTDDYVLTPDHDASYHFDPWLFKRGTEDIFLIYTYGTLCCNLNMNLNEQLHCKKLQVQSDRTTVKKYSSMQVVSMCNICVRLYVLQKY